MAMIHRDDRKRAQKESTQALQEAAPYDTEYRVIWPDNSEKWVSSKARVFFDTDARPFRMIGAMTDITERKQAEQELLNNRSQLKSLASELVLAEERERNRIAVHLHDDVSQSLAYSKMKLQVVNTAIDDKGRTKDIAEVCDTLTR
jgi:signal transduction histidine kinase